MVKTTLNYWSEGDGPEYFYKYRSVNKCTKNIILNHSMYFSCADDFNDPFEYLPIFVMEGSKVELRKYHEKQLDKISRHLRRSTAVRTMELPNYPDLQLRAIKVAREAVDKQRKTVGILCLSSQPDQMLLWSHYANSHKGIVLRFKPEKHDGYFDSACPVTYQKERPKLNLVTHKTEEMTKLGLLTKADYWEYEKEWRILGGLNSTGECAFKAEQLDGIILGAKISSDDEKDVREWVNSAGLKITWYKASINNNDFRLDIISC